MLFNSFEYIFLFMPVTIIVFFLIARWHQQKLATTWLAATSLFFYGWWNPVYVSLILVSMVFNFLMGVQLQKRANTDKLSKGLLGIGIAVNLFLIGYFKYANFFVNNLNLATGSTFHLEKIILPLGISFFTFTQIAFLVDAYKKEIRETNFLHYFLFVTFFPHLIAGPVLHHKEIMPQFGQKDIYKPHTQNFALGTTIFAIGLFKKVILADGVAQYASSVFLVAEKGVKLITFFDAWEGALAYTLQIYFDFSGYSDMAIGSALMFGIKLPINFNSPYKSLNIIEFWRRWHMTLSRFMRDYLYVPLGGSKGGTSRKLNNLMMTMLLGGLWHGAGWTFIAWGALHGLYLVINHSWRAFREKVLRHDLALTSLPGKLVSIVLTLLAVTIGWVLFRADTITGAKRILMGMSGVNGAFLPTAFTEIHPAITIFLNELNIKFAADSGTVFTAKWTIILLTSLVLFLPNSTQYVNSLFKNTSSNGKLFTQATFTTIILFWAVIAINKPSEFLYFQF